MKKDRTFWAATALSILTIVLTVPVRLGFIDTHFLIGPFAVGHIFDFDHVFVSIGTFFIAIYTPIYYVLKRRHPAKLNALLNIHIFGSLLSFLFISIHYAVAKTPRTAEGLGLYVTVILLTVTGYIHRFNLIPEKMKNAYPPHFNRWLHISLTTAFYIMMILHVLKRTGIII